MTECAGRIRAEEAVEVGVSEAEAGVEVGAAGISAVEGADAGLAESVVETAIRGDRGGWLLIDDGQRRRGGTVDI